MVYVDLLYCTCQSIVQFFWLAMVNYHEDDLKAAKRKVIVIILVTLIFYSFVYYDFRWVTGDSLNKACCRGKPSANFMTVQIPPQTNRGSKSGCQWLIGAPILGVYSQNSRYPFRIRSVLLMTSTYSRFLDVDEIKKSWEVPKFYVNVVSI